MIYLSISGCQNEKDIALPATWIEFELNDSLLISLPDTYGDESGLVAGIDTWIFYKSRDDMKVELSFEVGPGTPYTPETIASLPDTHIVYPYGHTSPESHITIKYSNLLLIDLRNKQRIVLYRKDSDDPRFQDGVDGVVLIESSQSKTFTDILFLSYSYSEAEEVIDILKSIRNK
jgi:hypothetical protein